MTYQLLFWILMLLWLFFGYRGRPAGTPFTASIPDLILWVLIALLGWKGPFGAALHN